MNARTALARALRAHAALVDDLVDETPAISGESRINEPLKTATELGRVLARLLEGKPPIGSFSAFGAPGDWGYGTPIGDALLALYREPKSADSPFPYALPALGTYWPGEGGQFSGIFADTEGAMRALILGEPAPDERMPWKRGIEWSKDLDIDGHRDFLLPDRREGRLLWINRRDCFDLNAWYWLREERSASGAYTQGFDGGDALYGGKNYEARVRACRSFILRSFDPSIAIAAGKAAA